MKFSLGFKIAYIRESISSIAIIIWFLLWFWSFIYIRGRLSEYCYISYVSFLYVSAAINLLGLILCFICGLNFSHFIFVLFLGDFLVLPVTPFRFFLLRSIDYLLKLIFFSHVLSHLLCCVDRYLGQITMHQSLFGILTHWTCSRSGLRTTIRVNLFLYNT